MIRNPDDKELKYFAIEEVEVGGVDNTRWKKVQSDPMLIFLSGNRPLFLSSHRLHVCLCLLSAESMNSVFSYECKVHI